MSAETVRVDAIRGLHLEGESYMISWASEFDLRDGIAKLAELAGWEVETEHVVHGWGRPDLYLKSDALTIAVELKTELDTASQCRKAVQQAASYRKAMPEVCEVILAAASINSDAMREYEASYREVWVLSANALCDFILGAVKGLRDRHTRARQAYVELERELELSRRVLGRLATREQSPLGAVVFS